MDTKLVLVVDDEEDWRERVSEIASSLALQPLTARDAGEAMNLLQQHAFALVITDNYMPCADQGIELLQYINRRFPTTGIPSILHSSTPPKDLELLCEVFSWVTFVRKEYKAECLEQAIRQALIAA